MKYNIHVGDYVETITGKIGWIDYIVYTGDPRVYINMTIRTGSKYTYSEFHGYEDELGNYFIRVGKYDFTRVEKIDKLDTLKTVSMYTGAPNTKYGFEQVRERSNFEDKVQDKINELIDKVNYLLDKQNKA